MSLRSVVKPSSKAKGVGGRLSNSSNGPYPVARCTVLLYAYVTAEEKSVPFLTVLAAPVRSTGEDSTVESFNLTVNLRMVSCGKQVKNSQNATNILE